MRLLKCRTWPASLVTVLIATGPVLGQTPTELSAHWGNLEGEWLFRPDPEEVGETEGWMRADFDDSEWRTLNVPGYWEAQGVTDPRPGEPPKPKGNLPWTDYDGVAWYRLRFIVPEDWDGQDLVLSLGSVDDHDRTHLNGELVGETGRGVPRAVSVQRVYRVSPEHVAFGEENVLALRVEDNGGPGGFIGPLVSLLPAGIAEAGIMLPQDDRPLIERFIDPPASSRILKIVHSLPDDPEAQDALIHSLASQGFGGMACNISFDEYLQSEEKWAAFVRGVTEAKKAGMSLWLYDEKGYPSGAAGGLTLRDHPEWEARGLLIAEARTTGDQVALDLPPGDLFFASAYPVTDGLVDNAAPIDLSEHIRDGKLTWDPPAGRWHVMAITEDRLYEGTHAAHSLADKLPYINLLMPEPTQRFIEVTHAEYARRLGDDLGEWFVATFTDEPSLMSLFMKPMPYKVLPWSPDLPEEFERRRAYSLDQPLIAALVVDSKHQGARVRHDFWLTVGELVSENYFGQIEEFCHQHNFRSGGHLLWEESIRNHVAFYGDFFRCLRRLDAPSIDCLTSIPAQAPWHIARLIGSAADLDAKPFTMCETSDFSQRYRPEGDERPVINVTEDDIRGTCNRLMLGGINTITSYYTFYGLTSEELRRLNEWVGRCSTVLRGGHQVTDIAVLYPIESLWTRFTPARHGAGDSPGATQLEQIFNGVSNGLYAARRDFTYIDARTLAEGSVQDGALVHGDMRWRVIVLPCVDTLPDEAWLTLRELWREGGVIIAIAARPENSAREFPSPSIEELGREILGDRDEPQVVANEAGGAGVYLPASAASLLPAVLDSVIEADVKVSDPQSSLRITHRRIEGQEVYFVINDSANPVDEQVALAVAGAGEHWHPDTGETTAASGSTLELKLGPYDGAILRFENARGPERYRIESGALPSMEIAALPVVQPAEGHGEFVQGSLTEDAERSQPDAPAWRAIGKLTKSDVDTHLFVSFRYPDKVDLTEAACLVLDTWVPEGQQTPSQILVILHEADGADYLGQTGRSLSASGHARTYVPLTGFDLAGWTEDANGRPDLDSIIRISIGWGGYFGTEGETIDFTLALPHIARRQPL